MVTQTIQFETVSPSEIGSGTITAFLFSGATLSATLASITENATLKGRHTGTVADIAAGEYRLVVKFDGYTVSEQDEVVTLLLAVGTYVASRPAELDSATQAQIAVILADTNELQTDWANGGRLDLILDIIASDTTTDIPALIAALNNLSAAQVTAAVPTVVQIQSGLATQASVDTIDNLLDTEMPALTIAVGALQTDLTTTMLWTKRNAVILTGIISSAGTATEVFTVSSLGITATVSVDASGNRSAVVWS